MKTALVLEGGAKRGIYTAGVLECFAGKRDYDRRRSGRFGRGYSRLFVRRAAGGPEHPVQSQVWRRLPLYEFPVIAFEREYGRYAVLLS